MSWADVIVPVGGDGTFLLSAGRASPLFALSQQNKMGLTKPSVCNRLFYRVRKVHAEQL